MIRILPPTPGEIETLSKVASEDNHGVFYPTDIIHKEGEIVGYLSIAGLPTVQSWLSTKRIKARETTEVFNYIEGVTRRFGQPGLIVPVPKDSPVHPYMGKLGYTNGGTYDFFFKTF